MTVEHGTGLFKAALFIPWKKPLILKYHLGEMLCINTFVCINNGRLKNGRKSPKSSRHVSEPTGGRRGRHGDFAYSGFRHR